MLLWTESAQRLRSTTMLQRRGYSGSFAGWQATGGRNNGPVIQGHMGSYLTDPAPSGSTCIMGVRFNITNSAFVFLMQFNLAGTEQCSVRVTGSTGVVTVTRNGTVLASSPAGTVQLNTLSYMAVRLVIDNSVGTSIVYLDGVEIPSLTLTGQDTQSQATATWDSFAVGGYTGGTGVSWCDLYVLDGTQPHANDPNTILTDARVDYCAPDGNGYISNFLGSDGNSTDNYLLVDENNPDDDTTYVELTAAGIDAYTVANLPQPGSTIVGVSSFMHERKTDAGTGVARSGIRSGGTNYTSPLTKGVGITFRDHYRCWGHDPNGGAWTEAAFNATEVLVEKV